MVSWGLYSGRMGFYSLKEKVSLSYLERGKKTNLYGNYS